MPGDPLFKRLGTHISVLTVTAWQLIVGSLPLLAASAIVERGALVTWNIQFVGALLFLALVGTALANAAWFWLVQSGEVSRLIIFLYIVPVFGLALAALALGERMGWLEGIGSALILAAIASSAWEAWRGGLPHIPHREAV
jgi:drug/metabolite transporter (DMT)-like permease